MKVILKTTALTMLFLSISSGNVVVNTITDISCTETKRVKKPVLDLKTKFEKITLDHVYLKSKNVNVLENHLALPVTNSRRRRVKKNG